MDPPWVTKAKRRGSYTRERGRSSSKSSGSSYGSSSSSQIIQMGGMILVKLTRPSKEATSSIHLDDILENNPVYAQLQAYLSQKQSNTFASVAKEEEYIHAFDKVLIYNNERHKHTWFIKDGNKEEMINNYLDEVRKNILLNITQYEKSDTSMRSETSDDIADIQEAQLCEPTTEDVLEKVKDLLRNLKGKDHM
ncbi:hypothetical protein H5410_002672 [Solanum commersonii]|uniref:Uncharacterized protein n=1 Tax=Solanum commersonii TaxID=4109 RepID=A0A9J6B2X5_SOLCO|nr:hypothetical protein H5410_002672 [Solanum commersonii]